MRKAGAALFLFLLALPTGGRAQGFERAPLEAAQRGRFPRALHAIGHELKMTFVDMKRHPYAWGLNAGLQIGIAFSDTASSCKGYAEGMVEIGSAGHFIGRYPNCRKAVLLTATAMTIHLTAEHALSNWFAESCQREAANPDSRWWKTPARTHDPESCRWAVPTADTLALAAYEIPVIKGNID